MIHHQSCSVDLNHNQNGCTKAPDNKDRGPLLQEKPHTGQRLQRPRGGRVWYVHVYNVQSVDSSERRLYIFRKFINLNGKYTYIELYCISLLIKQIVK